MDGNLVVTANKVHLRKYDFSSQPGREVLNMRYRVTIRCRGLIEVAVIPTRVPSAARFLHNV